MAGQRGLRRALLLLLVAAFGFCLSRILDQRVGTGVVVIAVVEQLAMLAGLLMSEEGVTDLVLSLVGMTMSSFLLHLTWDPLAHQSPESLIGGFILLMTLGTWRVISALRLP